MIYSVIASAPAYSQFPFSFNRNFISQETYCFQLKDSDAGSEEDIVDVISRLGEQPLSASATPVFRIIDYEVPGHVKDVVIRTIEKADSTCIVTIKLIKNHRRNQVFVHCKTYNLDKWEDFAELARKYFRTDSEFSNVKTFHYEGSHQKYEYYDGRDYHVLSEVESGSNVIWLRDYIEYMLSPIFEETCPKK